MPHAAHANERAELEQLRDTVTDMVEALVASGALSRAKADQLLARARTKAGVAASTAPAAPGAAAVAAVPATGVGVRSNAPATASAQPPVARPGVRTETAAASEPVRVQYVPEAVRNEITQQVRQQVVAQAREERWGDPGALPDWVERFRFSGDLRVRLQQDNFSSSNAPPAVLYDEYGSGTNYADTTNTTVDRSRQILRARFGVAAIINDQWTSAIRITTGNTLGPTSTSSTAGDASGRYGVKIDRAYMKWQPNSDIAFLAGRLPNPYLSTEMMFAEELGFDGQGFFPFTPEPPPPPPVDELNKVDFLRLFTQAERIAIRQAATAHPTIADYQAMLDAATIVRLSDPDMQVGVPMLELGGLLDPGRAAQILAGVRP